MERSSWNNAKRNGKRMNFILIMLCGILMGAFNFGFFCLGYYVRSKKKEDNAVQLDAENGEAIKNLLNWMKY